MATANVGPELEEVNTEGLGFKTLHGEKKLKLLSAPWPADNLPPSSACLLSAASKRGLVAAAGPDQLVVATADSIRAAFEKDADESTNVVTDFSPAVTIPVPKLRHVAFSSDEDFLVISAEEGGGLAIYDAAGLLENKLSSTQFPTDQTPVRALVPNPNPQYGHFFAAVLDSGRLLLIDVTQKKSTVIHEIDVTCVAWSIKGLALVAGLKDGSAVQYKTDGKLLATVPAPPEMDPDFIASAVYWLNNKEFFIVHSPTASADGDMPPDSTYHIVKLGDDRTQFTYHKCPFEIFFASMGPQRPLPPRFSVNRLRVWEPELDDMLIVAASHSEQIKTFTKTSQPISSEQKTLNDFTFTELLDNRRAELPKMVNGDEDSVLIGEALDLSSKEKVLRPIPMDDEYAESPGPLPAYYILNHEGILCGWWIVYDKAIREGKSYPGLISLQATAADASGTPKASQPSQATTTPAQTSATFGTPSKPAFGASSFGTPAFPPPSAAFGKTAFGVPSLGTPSFGSVSQPGAPAFGAPGLVKPQSPWGSASSTATSTQQNPFAAQANKPSGFAQFGSQGSSSTAQPNPFAAPASSEGFAKFGAKSAFGGGSNSSPFGNLAGQKSVFGASQPAALSKESSSATKSFGSTLSVGSSFGDGSTLPSWANTPAGTGGSIFGKGTNSSFASSKDTDLSGDSGQQNRERDESTPTPQAPSQQPKGLFGLPSSSAFKLGSSFKGDGSAKDDLPKPATPGGSLFSGDFASTLSGISSKSPATPVKKEEQDAKPGNVSTTPATMPKSTFSGFFPKPSETKTIKPVDEEESPVAEEAPLPPDFTTWKPPKGADDDLPPLAGSPGVKVEAPSSDGIPSSPLEDNEDDESGLEDEEGEEEEEESQPSTEGEQKAPAKANIFGKANDTSSPRIRPAAPTPPAVSSQATPPSLFGQTPKPSSTSIFQASATPAGFPKFQAPPSRRHENLRSPSPVRSASTSILQTRRQPPFPAAETLSSSVQQAATPPIAQPELSDLYDEEDERIRLELATEPEPSASLADFIAHSDYSGAVSKTGTAAQIEIMYRDMNSMVDTIGLNARSMKAFIAHHADRRKITRHDLDGITEQGEDGPWFDDWSLAQIEDLKLLEHELERDLDEGRIQGVIDKLGQLARLLLDKAKLMTKLNDIRRQILNRKDPERQEALLKAALPKELAEQQKTLRNEYAQLLSLLGKAEEAAYLLKSKLASINAANGRPSAVPTVDAVKKTINTLIRMTEKKNSEIVAMEDQLRRFMGDSHRQNGTPSRSHGTPSRTLGTPSRSARSILRQSSPLATPPTNRSRMSLSELNRTVQTPEPDETPSKGYGLYYTPDSSPKADGAGRLAKLADDLDDADMAELVAASQRRRQVADVLGNAVRKRGVKVTKVANVTKVA